MSRIFQSKRSINNKIPRRSSVEQNKQYTQPHKGIEICPGCENAHFKKHWYHSVHEILKHSRGNKPKITEKKYCPACSMARSNTFEGEILIENVPREQKVELLHLIENFGNRAQSMDPQDRILHIKKTTDHIRMTLRIVTSENQLAEKIGKKIKEVFNKVLVRSVHSKEPYEVTRVRVVFQ